MQKVNMKNSKSNTTINPSLFHRDMLMLKSAEVMYKNYIKLSRTNHECPLCERGFEEEQLQVFLKKVAFTSYAGFTSSWKIYWEMCLRL